MHSRQESSKKKRNETKKRLGTTPSTFASIFFVCQSNKEADEIYFVHRRFCSFYQTSPTFSALLHFWLLYASITFKYIEQCIYVMSPVCFNAIAGYWPMHCTFQNCAIGTCTKSYATVVSLFLHLFLVGWFVLFCFLHQCKLAPQWMIMVTSRLVSVLCICNSRDQLFNPMHVYGRKFMNFLKFKFTPNLWVLTYNTKCWPIAVDIFHEKRWKVE